MRLIDRIRFHACQMLLVMAYKVIEGHGRYHRRVAQRLKLEMPAAQRAFELENDQVSFAVDAEQINAAPGINECPELF